MSFNIRRKYYEFAIPNNQSSVTNVGGIILDSNQSKSYTIKASVVRQYTNGLQPGKFDSTFVDNFGQANTNFIGASQTGCNVGYQSTGKIIIGGTAMSLGGLMNPSQTAVLIRLNADGTVDSTFNMGIINATDARISTNIGGVFVQSDDKIIIIGSATLAYGGSIRAGIMRLNADGTEDTAFTTNLGTQPFTNNPIRGACIQADGKILICGQFTTLKNGTVSTNRIARINADGTLDTVFTANFTVGSNSATTNIIRQLSDTSIVYGGQFTSFNGVTISGIFKTNSAGVADATFNGNVGAGGNATVSDIKEDPVTHSLYVYMSGTTWGGFTFGNLVRLNSNGTVDITYKNNAGTGLSSTPPTPDGTYVDPSGNCYVPVSANASWNGVAGYQLAIKISPTGIPDATFKASLPTLNASFNGSGKILFRGVNNSLFAFGQLGNYGGAVVGTLVNIPLLTRDVNLVSETELIATYNGTWSLTNNNTPGMLAQDPYTNSTIAASAVKNCGVNFTITAGGQLQYTSTNLPGSLIASKMGFVITPL